MGVDGRGHMRPRSAWVLAMGCLAALLLARIGAFLAGDPDSTTAGNAVGLGLILGLAALLVVVVLLGVASRRSRAVLVVMAALTFAPYLVYGTRWGPIAGLLAGALALNGGARAWRAFAWVVVGDTSVFAVLLPSFDVWAVAGRLLVDVSVGLLVFGVMRLASLIQRSEVARRELATWEVLESRLRTAGELRRTVAEDVASVLGRLRSLDPSGPEAADDLRTSAEQARTALARTRGIVQGHREESYEQDQPRRDSPEQPTAATSGAVPDATREARQVAALLVAVHIGVAMVNMGAYPVAIDAPIAAAWVVTALASLAVGILHMHTTAPPHESSSASTVRRAFVVQIVVTTAVVTYVGIALIPLLLLLGAAAVVRLRLRWAIVALALVAGWYIHRTAGLGANLADHFYQVGTTLTSAAVFYALWRLPAAAHELARTGRAAARMAVIKDRLRMARDLHDLLGAQLSGLALRAEVVARDAEHAGRVSGDDLAAITHLADRALAEVRSLTEGVVTLHLDEEIEAARAMLEAMGAEVEVEVPATAIRDPAASTFAVVVREAATNIARHSVAEHVTIRIEVEADAVLLRVLNDGANDTVLADAEHQRQGTGVESLKERLSRIAGTLHTEASAGGAFALIARAPLLVGPSTDLTGGSLAASAPG